MVITATGSVRGQAVSTAAGPSKARLNDVAIALADDTGTIDLNAFSLWIGVSATRPTLFSSLATPAGVDSAATGFPSLSYTEGFGTIRVSVRDTQALGAFTVGDHLWLCVFNIATPIAGTAVLVAVDLGLLLA
jgi:hypothetical protein